MPRKKKEEKSVPVKIPKPESTPLKFWKNEGDDKPTVAVVTDGSGNAVEFTEVLKKLIGVKDSDLAAQIFHAGVSTIKPLSGEVESLNVIAQAMNDLQPKDATEARLAAQASALFSHGMSNLRRSETAEMLDHAEHYGNKAMKLLRLHNETVDALNRYRRKGEQKVIVQHVTVADGGQAVVGGQFSHGGGGSV